MSGHTEKALTCFSDVSLRRICRVMEMLGEVLDEMSGVFDQGFIVLFLR